MFRPKGRSSLRFKSASLLTLNEIEDRDKSKDWRKNYQVKPKEIGRGHFSKVYHVTCDKQDISFAAKVIRRRKGGIDRLDKIKQEVALIKRLNELGVQSVIQLYKTHESFSEVVIISELAIGGSLYKLVHESDLTLSLNYVKVVTYKLLFALEAMHKEKIVHLDIKADNILLRETYPSTNIALCDFGLATQLKEGKSHKELVGTPDYMAPEVINYEKVTVNADMWSVGVVVYYLLTGVSPFMGKTKDETLVNVSKVNISFDEMFNKPDYIESKDFILSLCVKSPQLRLSSMSAQQHPWFNNIDDINLDFPSEENNINCDTNMSDFSENEDDSNRLSQHHRCLSVDFNCLNMSFRSNSFLAASCENLSTDTRDFGSTNNTFNNRSIPKKLMNVEEVYDEGVNESMSSGHNEPNSDIKSSDLNYIGNDNCVKEMEDIKIIEVDVTPVPNDLLNITKETLFCRENSLVTETNNTTTLPSCDKLIIQMSEIKSGDCIHLRGVGNIDSDKCVKEKEDIKIIEDDVTPLPKDLLNVTKENLFCPENSIDIQTNNITICDKVIIPTSDGRGLLIEILKNNQCQNTPENNENHPSESYINICTFNRSKNDKYILNHTDSTKDILFKNSTSPVKDESVSEHSDIYCDKNCPQKSWSIFELCSIC